ncbi:MAG: M28 family peptidase [Flavobacteriaceae bacterium]|nr:M28 family peptidase [Flavobacteriaceae bacterium]RZV62031.1 MAG: M28 family peptidase [Flavobacteriaceae bacterium]
MLRLLLIFFLLSSSSFAQTVSELIDEVDVIKLSETLNELSGEVSTVVDGNTVTILNRVSNTDNNIAADYLLQKFNALPGLIVNDQDYSPGVNGGRNIIATQIGQTNPNDIYIICAHYDAVADYCADDNVSGTAAVLEIARILSQYNSDSTIVYALWDQEEIGLLGSNYYAQQAATNGDNILGVFNMDMMAHDGDGDNDFDIDVRPIANSIAMKDEIISILNTYKVNNDIDLNVNVVNPGTAASDHSRFWNQGFSAVLFGEAWSNGDQTEDYHQPSDRVSTLDLDYFHDMVKLAMGYMATKAGFNVLSLDDLEAIGLSVFPNPVKDMLNIKLREAIETDFEIADMNGKTLLKRTIVNLENSLEVSQLPEGIYFINLKNEKGQRVIKVIKE